MGRPGLRTGSFQSPVAVRSNVIVTGAGSYHEPLTLKWKLMVTGSGSYHEPCAFNSKFTVTGAGTTGPTRVIPASLGIASPTLAGGVGAGVGVTATGGETGGSVTTA